MITISPQHRKQGDFPQTISYMNDINGDVVNNVALPQYTLAGKEHDAQMPHGRTQANDIKQERVGSYGVERRSRETN